MREGASQPGIASISKTSGKAIPESAEYREIVEHYTDKSGKFSYELLNKDLIQLTHRSSKVREMVEEKATLDRIRIYTVGAKFRTISGNHDLSNNKIRMMIELLDGIYPKSILKELTEDIKKRLKR